MNFTYAYAYDPNPTNVHDMGLSDLMMRFQFWNFEECVVTLHRHFSKIHPGQELCSSI